jgi:hypothetical protein
LTLPDKIKKEVFYDNNPINVDEIDLSLEHLGLHSIFIKAKDEAGNESEKKINFEIETDIRAIISNIDHYFDLGFIHKKSTRMMLQARLQAIEGKIFFLKIFENKWMPWWAKERMVKNMKNQINREIEMLSDQIQSQGKFGDNIDSKVKELLLESLENIKL